MRSTIKPGQLWMMSNGDKYLVLSESDKEKSFHDRHWVVFSETDRGVYTWSEQSMGPTEGDKLVAYAPAPGFLEI